jgi:hypothetical protein
MFSKVITIRIVQLGPGFVVGHRMALIMVLFPLTLYFKVPHNHKVKYMTTKLAVLFAVLTTGACSHSNNLLLGRVEAKVGTHSVVVTDCYRTSVPQPEKMLEPDSYRFVPCKDAAVVLRGPMLTVNGKQYGPVQTNDQIIVDHGVVSVNHR